MKLLPGSWCLRVGTCLRKCYFADYRFSEDLDFTATGYLSADDLETAVMHATEWTLEQNGPDYAIALHRIDVVNDEYGNESFQVRVYYEGPLRWGGSPRTIRLDITRHESLLLPAVLRELIHPYTDQSVVMARLIPCYDLAEVLAEKLRAVGGQRQFAISRDIYDIDRLIQSGVEPERAINIIPEKYSAREIDIAGMNVEHILRRRAEFEMDWKRRLDYLVPSEHGVTFDHAFKTTVDLVRFAQQQLREDKG